MGDFRDKYCLKTIFYHKRFCMDTKMIIFLCTEEKYCNDHNIVTNVQMFIRYTTERIYSDGNLIFRKYKRNVSMT